MKSTYRPDIDGIRAVAVIAVIFYHADIKFFTGGYIGVDVFFVISGYLITTIILNELDANEFSLVKFYDRRIRRIFPALFTILAVTTFVASIFFDANEFQDYSKSLIATTLFASNILFWTQSGYYEGLSELKPLLHTWSLAIEEQYYIFFPLLLIFLVRYFRPKLALALLGLALASFAMNLYGMNQDTSGAFYLAHMRIWELLIGSLLATKSIPTKTNPHFRNLLSLLGLTMIVVPVVLYTSDTPFPGFAATIPTLGTALIIYSGIQNKTFAGQILSFGPIVFIGKISYSLYLWHWPVIVFAKYYSIIGLKSLEMAAVLLGVFILSTLSWLFIENPFRHRIFLNNHRVFRYAGIVMLVALTTGSIIFLNKGFPGRFYSKQIEASPNTDIKWNKCELEVKNLAAPLSLCTIGKDSNSPIFLLWGDSHAGALAPSIQISSEEAGISGVLAYANRCPPLLGVDREGPRPCNEFNTTIIDYIRDHPELNTIILAGRWALSAEGIVYKNEEGGKSVTLVNVLTGPTETDTNADLFKLGLEQTVNELLGMGRKVVIVTQVPEVGYNVATVLSIAQRTGRDLNKLIAPSLNEYIERNMIVTAAVESMAKRSNVQIVEPWRALCNETYCTVVSKEQSLYRDSHHLSTFGAQYISHIFDPVFENLNNK